MSKGIGLIWCLSLVFGVVMGKSSYEDDGNFGMAVLIGGCLAVVAFAFFSWWRWCLKSKYPMKNGDQVIRDSNPLHYPPDQL